MKTLRSFALAAFSTLSLLSGVLAFQAPVAHAQIDTGLNAVGSTVKLGGTDPRVIAARVINVTLGLLGIVMVSLIIYAGFLWMTSGGDAEKVGTAKRIIQNSIIGLVIILSSWAIATFVINALLNATGGGGGSSGGGGGPGGGGLPGGGGGAGAFQVQSIAPSGAVSIRNIEVHFVFSRSVDAGTANANIQVLKASDNSQVSGTVSVVGSVVNFTPAAACPPPNDTRKCFESGTEYIAKVLSGLHSSGGQSIVCGGFAPACEVRFTSGDLVDTAAPNVTIEAPFDGQSVPADDIVVIRSHATDDAGISYVESFVDATSVGIGVNVSGTGTDQIFESTWDTTGLSRGSHAIQSKAFDIDSNNGQSSIINVVVRPQHCFNGSRDSDETGLDCGGADCGVCSGGACTSGADCSSGVCTSGVCVEQPIITGVSPHDGRPGNLVTLTGANFGTSTGQVVFSDGKTATAPAACTAAGLSTWSPTQVVVAVPAGTIDGPVSLRNGSTGLSDATNDDRGPHLDNFDVNDIARPGLCAASPNNGLPGERISLFGAGLGASSDRVFFNDREISSFLSWSDELITLNAPVISPATYAVKARSGGVESNTVNYRINERVATAGPIIDSVTPDNGPIGEYITIQGRNFGNAVGLVNFRRSDGVALADTHFPAECSTAFWSDSTITVKVPAIIRAGLGDEAITPGAYQIEVQRQDTAVSNRYDFAINTNPAHPGICAVRPSAGPVGTPIQVIGERLGSSGTLSFAGSSARVSAGVRAGDWTDARISSTVPTGAVTGPVSARVGTIDSNSVNFAVRNCNEDASICSSGEICCRSGACSVGGACAAASPEAMFAWRLSTGVIPVNPQVIEECSATKPPSPSPWNARAGGTDVCVNADVYVRLSTHLDPATVTNSSFIFRKCSGSGTSTCDTGTVIAPAGGFPLVGVNDTEGYIRFRTPANVDPASTYQVVLTTAIQSETHVPMLERSDCGAGNAYCFTFTTRASTENCMVGSINVVPSPNTMNDLGQTQVYNAVARAAGDQCIVLRGDTYDWDWSTSDGRASITHNRAGGLGLDTQTVTALAETGASPVHIDASITDAGRTVTGEGDLFIRFVPPKIEAYGPNCDSACLNAAIWARFNVPMDPASFHTADIVIKRCTNENCVSYDSTLALTASPILSAVPGTSDPSLRFLRIDPTVVTGAGIDSLLERGRFYRVTIMAGTLSGPRSSSGLPLSGLNTADGFTWTFRVKDDENARCSVDHVDMAPTSKIESVVGAHQSFAASPHSSADSCSADGEPLVADREYSWSINQTGNVSRFINASGPGLTDTAATPAPGCSNNCTQLGSTGVAGRTASCGDHVVQTTDSRYCRNSTDTGPCAVGGSGCQTIFHDPCKLLPAGSTGGEECDQGGETTACSAQCLWKPTTAATCGNNRLDPGEQCDPGSTPTTSMGCSSDCQLLGARLGGSTCGNNDVAAGEACDDGNTRNGDGCSSDCLHEGSSVVRALCGNGILEPGEACEPGPGSAETCDPLTCLHLGTAAPTCGNGHIDAGEDCDDGNTQNSDGCSNRCLNEGSSSRYAAPSMCADGVAGLGEAAVCEAAITGDGHVDGVQIAEIVGDADPDTSGRMMSQVQATYDTKVGSADYGLQCGFTVESACPAGTGLDAHGCCAPRPRVTTAFPAGGATGVCRNVQVSGIFNVEMDTGTLQTNFIVAERASGADCPSGSTPLTVGAPTSWWMRVVNWFRGLPAEAQLYCAGLVSGSVNFVPVVSGGVTSTKATLNLAHALKPDTEYRVRFAGDINLADNPAGKTGVLSKRGVVSEGNIEWVFTTGPAICTVNSLLVADTNLSSPAYFSTSNETHVYTAAAVSINSGHVTPLSSVAEYAWTWAPWVSSDETVLHAEATAGDPSLGNVSSHAKNGSSLIFGQVRITNDEVNTPSTTNRYISGSLPSTVMLCENPWPRRDLGAFQDLHDSAAMAFYAPAFAGGPYYNFSTMYCRDANAQHVTSDDLPDMNVAAVPLTALDTGRGILRQYLFTFDNTRFPALAGDGIGIRIVSNPLHLSPSEWYASKGFSGSPQSTTVDGYEAVKDGNTTYIAAPNTDDLTAAAIYPNIYVISRNPDAKDETQKIFDQLVSNFALNINLQADSSNSCIYAVADAGHVPDEPFLVDGKVVACTADWECLSKNRSLRCASFKSKLQRDVKRISDFQRISSTLESSKSANGKYPALSSGSFLATFSTSRWPSWTGALASSAGSLPTDPINRFLSCGRCSDASASACTTDADCSAGSTCQSLEVRPGLSPEASTCWAPASRQYVCPQLNPAIPASVSRIYQYRAINAGETYELGTELEAAAASRYRPNLPTLTFRCSNIHTACTVDADCTVAGLAPGSPPASTGRCERVGGSFIYNGICTGSVFGEDNVCGNGVIGTGETCEIGQTRGVSCTTGSGAVGTKIQSCDACVAYRDTASSICVADQSCGNGRVERARCVGTGVKYGQSCSADTDCADARDAAGTIMTCEPFAAPEICDDGAQNGTYGHCNRTCTGFGAYCGDALLSPGETCDQGTGNGVYCERGLCTPSATCSTDCRGLAPYCGDSRVDTPREQCDGNTDHTAQAICTSGSNIDQPCTSDAQCGAGGHCGGTLGGVDYSACPATVNRCSNDRTRACTGPSDSSCGGAARCIAFAAERTRTCKMTAADVSTTAEYCTWKTWSACEAVGSCGNGTVDTGEECDDGNTSNNDSCTNACVRNTCGDGFANPATEECDNGDLNGTTSCSADYGASCISCSTTCHAVASSGGYCGNNHKEGPEQCDGTDLGASTPSCRALGYDYAQYTYCAPYTRCVSPSGSLLATYPGGTCGVTCSVPAPGGGCLVLSPPTDNIDCLGRGGTCVEGSAAPQNIDTRQVAACRPSPTPRDGVSCNSTCGYNGCLRCSETTGDGVISGSVYDAVYSFLPVPNARVTLYSRGIRVSETFTSKAGNFTFNNLNTNPVCASYKIVVDYYLDNPCTGATNAPGSPDAADPVFCGGTRWPLTEEDPDESTNGGYWPYDSDTFSSNTFLTSGVHNPSGRIFLAPRVGAGETLVVHTWSGNLPDFIDAHLIVPEQMKFTVSGSSDLSTPGLTFFNYTPCALGASGCKREIRYGSQQGNPDMSVFPHANQYCFNPIGGGQLNLSCNSFITAPQTMKFKRGDWATTGKYSFYLVDYWSAGPPPPSYKYYDFTSSSVRIVTQDNIYTVDAPIVSPTTASSICTPATRGTPNDGKFWLVFQQDAISGAITIPSTTDSLRCTGQSSSSTSPGFGSENLPAPMDGT